MLVVSLVVAGAACDEQFVAGGGGAGGTSSGTSSGTNAGSPAGTSGGAAAGTSAGTPAGSSTGTDTGTTTDTGGQCPIAPCTADGSDFLSCASASECLAAFCSGNFACCHGTWSADCARVAIHTCGTSICETEGEACAMLFGGTSCATISNESCAFVFVVQSEATASCGAICGAQGARCLGGHGGDHCLETPPLDASSCWIGAPAGSSLECSCALACEETQGSGLCEPGVACVRVPESSAWMCEP